MLTSLLFPIGIFPWLMIGLTPIFLDPGWPRRLVGTATAAAGARVARMRWERPIMAMLAVHLVLQTVIPLRALVASDDIAWDERGFRFAWRVMVEVRADVWVALNGRPIVDPEADLAAAMRAPMLPRRSPTAAARSAPPPR